MNHSRDFYQNQLVLATWWLFCNLFLTFRAEIFICESDKWGGGKIVFYHKTQCWKSTYLWSSKILSKIVLFFPRLHDSDEILGIKGEMRFCSLSIFFSLLLCKCPRCPAKHKNSAGDLLKDLFYLSPFCWDFLANSSGVIDLLINIGSSCFGFLVNKAFFCLNVTFSHTLPR